MKKINYFVILIIIIIMSLSACTRYYKTRDIKKGYKKVVNRTAKAIKNAKNDYKKRLDIYNAVVPHASSKTIKPYPVLQNDLKQMKASLAQLDKHHIRLSALKKSLAKIVKKKKRIKSNKPEWNKVKNSNQQLENESELFSKEYKNYQSSANHFNKTSQTYKITRVKTSDINKKLTQLNIQMTKAVAHAHARIKKAQQKLAKMRSQDDRKSIDKKVRTLNRMERILTKITNQKKTINQYAQEFKTESGNRKQFWVGPDMASHTILLKIVNTNKAIKSLAGRFNRLAKSL